jgi:hypothetical protein
MEVSKVKVIEIMTLLSEPRKINQISLADRKTAKIMMEALSKEANTASACFEINQPETNEAPGPKKTTFTKIEVNDIKESDVNHLDTELHKRRGFFSVFIIRISNFFQSMFSKPVSTGIVYRTVEQAKFDVLRNEYKNSLAAQTKPLKALTACSESLEDAFKHFDNAIPTEKPKIREAFDYYMKYNNLPFTSFIPKTKVELEKDLKDEKEKSTLDQNNMLIEYIEKYLEFRRVNDPHKLISQEYQKYSQKIAQQK